MMQPHSSSASLQRVDKEAKQQFLLQYNPDRQLDICTEPGDCYFGGYPTLAQVNGTLGQSVSVAWLVAQLYDLSEYCGCKAKLEGRPAEQCARIITANYFYLKVSELMLFFYKFKSGDYGRFYGAVDPMVITTALKDFASERGAAIARHEQEERGRKAREEQARNPVMTWEEYCRRNGVAGRNPLGHPDIGL